MTRLRLVFVSLAVLISVGGGILVSRVFASVEVDRRARQHTVAERVFDEMERTLSTFLRDEEARSVGAYAELLSNPADTQAFVWGHFEIDAQGRPRASVDRVRETVSGIWTRTPESDRVVRSDGRDAPVEEKLSGRVSRAQAPGTTLVFDAKAGSGKGKREAASPAYEAFQSLNRGAALREERSRKVVVAESFADEAFEQESEAPIAASADALAAAESPAEPVRQHREESMAEAAPKRRAPSAASPPLAASEIVQRAFEADALEDLDAEDPEPEAAGTVAQLDRRAPRSDEGWVGELEAAPTSPPPALAKKRSASALIIDPMVGRPEGAAIVLSRTVWDGSQHRRQGLVVDRAALGAFLEREALTGLAGTVARFSAFDDAEDRGAAGYRHRFAEPFDALLVDLSIPPLPASGGERALPWLAVGLALAAALGLFAAYRMVAAEWAYAERRSNFVSAVSHELKTPLTAIRMYGEMLRDGLVASDEKRQEYYGAITSESERLSRLINNVLEFSSLEKGTRVPDLRVGDVAPVVREAAELLRPHVEGLGGRLSLEIDAGLPPVSFDRDAILQVLFNLVDNAAKYARNADDPTLHLHCRATPAGVELSLRDHGPGVAAEHLPHLLESFYRGEDELTRTTKGAGIGLALVRGLSEQMGARLALANADGGGFEVRLALPSAG